jgi:Protein of unknown function (DUF499)
MSPAAHWADELQLRQELLDTAGQIADLQMSLYSAVYTDRDVPYQDPRYYADITEPTVGLVRFMGAVARRLGTNATGGKTLFHLDQGMGGGKSHALVGLYHLANDPTAFLATDLGRLVQEEAQQTGGTIDLAGARAVVLSADNMTPGATSPEFGPATSLYERFLWALFAGDKARYQQHLAEGPNKAALARALTAAGGPVLILLDELMDYVMLLSDKAHRESMPGEKAFLNNLMDAVDDVPQVAFVVVMIRSDLDERGYTVEAEDFRGYVATRLERNGTTVAVTEAQDFSAIIRRRLFERPNGLPIGELAAAWRAGADPVWRAQVFDRLGASRGLAGFEERAAGSYPFAPDLMALVRDDWSRHAGFQRVRSTVEIFALTAYHWLGEHRAGRWAPPLIGVGDIPLTVALEQVLSSGLLHGNERAVQGFRQVAAADIVSKDATQGRANQLDSILAGRGVDVGQPRPALRMATALYCYSLVPRAQAKRGATKPELLSAVYAPGVAFHAIEEVFNALTDTEEGLGALERTEATGGGTPARFHLAITQTLRMFLKQAKDSVQPPERDAYLWERAKALANKGPFDEVIPVAMPATPDVPVAETFAEVDQNATTRLVVLDPRQWTLLNGRDTPTRGDIAALFGTGDRPLPVDNAASCVVACVNAQRRDTVRKRATEALAWRAVLAQLEPSDDKYSEADAERKAAAQRVDADMLKAYQHYAYLIRTDRAEVDWRRFDDDTKSSLKGGHVWDALTEHDRATLPGTLSGSYLRTLLERTPRALTLKEVTQQFYKNPAYPMVPSVDDIRRAVFDLLRGTDRYEIVDAGGEMLSITSADELSIGSMDQLLRKAAGAPQVDKSAAGHDGTPGTRTLTFAPKTAGDYRRYVLEVPNRSLVDPDTRLSIANLLQAVLDAVDPDTGGDVQLVDIHVNVTADPAAVHEVGDRASAAGAKWREEELDF